MPWQPIETAGDLPDYTNILARFKDGREAVGCFYRHDMGTEWYEPDQPLGSALKDEWPMEWKSLPPTN